MQNPLELIHKLKTEWDVDFDFGERKLIVKSKREDRWKREKVGSVWVPIYEDVVAWGLGRGERICWCGLYKCNLLRFFLVKIKHFK